MSNPFNSLLSNPTQADSRFVEGFVTSVDPIRSYCRVRTIKGQNVQGVTWFVGGGSSRSGEDQTPVLGDRVVVSFSLGYPIIFGFLPRIDDSESFATPIDSYETLVDTGNYSAIGTTQQVNANKPQDFLIGDQVLRSEGGGLFGVLRGGSIIAKASRLAQIFMSKYDDLVRVIARNFEVFTDSFADVSANITGRIYRFIGYADTFANGLTDNYKYNEYYGDTALAEYLKNLYVGVSPGTFPVTNDVLRKYTLTNGTNGIFMSQTVKLDGAVKTTVQTTNGSSITYTDQLNGSYTINSTAGTFSSVVVNPTSVTISQNGAAVVVLDSNGVRCDFSGHFVHIDSSGTHLG